MLITEVYACEYIYVSEVRLYVIRQRFHDFIPMHIMETQLPETEICPYDLYAQAVRDILLSLCTYFISDIKPFMDDVCR